MYNAVKKRCVYLYLPWFKDFPEMLDNLGKVG